MSNPLGITGIHHVSLRVANLERSLALYQDTLGFRVTTASSLDGRRFALLETGNSGYIELVETKTPVHEASADNVLWHFAVRVSSIERALESAERAGYTITRTVKSLELTDTARQQVFGIRVAFFRGPDGEEIELFEDRLGHT
jgi:glyoxylase I family protein